MKVQMKPVNEIIKRLNLEPNGRIQKFFTNVCAKKMNSYVPYEEGNLRDVIEIGDDYVKYLMPYAHYMYEGKVMGPNIPIEIVNGVVTKWISPKDKKKHYTGKDIVFHTEGTTSHWDKKMWVDHKDEIIKEITAEMRRISK